MLKLVAPFTGSATNPKERKLLEAPLCTSFWRQRKHGPLHLNSGPRSRAFSVKSKVQKSPRHTGYTQNLNLHLLAGAPRTLCVEAHSRRHTHDHQVLRDTAADGLLQRAPRKGSNDGHGRCSSIEAWEGHGLRGQLEPLQEAESRQPCGQGGFFPSHICPLLPTPGAANVAYKCPSPPRLF